MRSKAEIKSSPEKPPLCRVDLKAIPEELKKYPRWVFWKWVRKKGRNGWEWTKVPFNPHTGKEAKPNDPSTWGTWEDITRVPAWQRRQFDGLGFFFHEDDGFVGIDLDDARDLTTEELKPWAQKKVDELASYTEISPTLTGVKIVARGKKPGSKCKTAFADDEIEIYEKARFFCLTGQRWPDSPAAVEERTEQIAEVYFEVFGKPEKKKPQVHRSQPETRSLDDQEVIELASAAKNGDKFRRLLNGDTSDYNGDDSRADAALCAILAFYTDRDRQAMDRIFRLSGLYRPKWDERRGEKTYGQKTIDEACDFVAETYTGSRRSRSKNTSSFNVGDHYSANGSGERISDPSPAHLTDSGNAKRMIAWHGEGLRHCFPWKKWVVWKGNRWCMDTTAATTRRAKRTVSKMFDDAVQELTAIKAEADEEETE